MFLRWLFRFLSDPYPPRWSIQLQNASSQFNPTTLAKAHQKATTFEHKQKTSNGEINHLDLALQSKLPCIQQQKNLKQRLHQLVIQNWKMKIICDAQLAFLPWSIILVVNWGIEKHVLIKSDEDWSSMRQTMTRIQCMILMEMMMILTMGFYTLQVTHVTSLLHKDPASCFVERMNTGCTQTYFVPLVWF